MIKNNSVLTRIFGLVTGIISLAVMLMSVIYGAYSVAVNFGKVGEDLIFINLLSIVASLLLLYSIFKVTKSSWTKKPEVVLYKDLLGNVGQTLLVEMLTLFPSVSILIQFAMTPEEILPSIYDYINLGLIILVIVCSFLLSFGQIRKTDGEKVKPSKFLFGLLTSIGCIILAFIHLVLSFITLQIFSIFFEFVLLVYFIFTLLTQLAMGLTNRMTKEEPEAIVTESEETK